MATSAASERSTKAEDSAGLADQILSVRRGVPVRVDMSRFPEYAQDIYMRPPTNAALTAWEQSGIKFDTKGGVHIKHSPTRKAALIRICLSDKDGNLIFTQKHEEQIAQMDAPIVAHWFEQAMIISGQRKPDEDEELDEAIEEAEGN